MSFARIKETFARSPKHTKLIGIGSLLLAISTVLPWYADLDSYRIGDQFLGVTGPASFVGIVILLLSGFSFWIFSYHLLERHVPRLPVREGILHLFVAIESLFLLVLVNSIFFHPKFGVNITLKESRFGMTIAFAAAIVLLVGGYMKNKEEIDSDKSEGRLEPLIKLESTRPTAPASAQSAYQKRPHGVVAEKPVVPSAQFSKPQPSKPQLSRPPEQKKIIPTTRDGVKGFMFGERGAMQKHEEKNEESESGGSYMIKMDL